MMNLLTVLADPGQVARLQRFCGVEYEKPTTCDQQTQTRGECSDSDSNGEQDEKRKTTLQYTSDIDSSVSTQEDEGNNKARCRIVPSNNFEERNNNLNRVTDSEILHDKFNQIEKVRQKLQKLLKTNGYHIMEQCSRVCSTNIIHECKKPSAVTNSLKSTDDDRVSKSSENVAPAPPSPTVRIKYKTLLYLAHFGAFLGNEEFYLTAFPFCVWNVDSSITRKVAMLWCLVMYLGQATKDYLRWPRPRWPPVVRLETHYAQEFSMPSTHAMAGTAIPICLAFYAIEKYQIPWPIPVMVALLWFSVTCWSRLFLGVHTLLDLLVGILYALLILLTFVRYVDECDLYQQTHPFAALILLFTGLALCTICYPSNYKNSSKGDAVQIVAALIGVGIGSWLGYHLGYFHESDTFQPYSITLPTLSNCGIGLLRFMTGILVLALLYAVTRWLSIRFYSYLYGLDVPDKTFPSVMTAYKFTTYAVVGAGISFFAPLVHLYMGIHRPAYFYEVL